MMAGLPGKWVGETHLKNVEQVRNVDDEWVALIVEAKAIGLTAEEVGCFLQKAAKTH